MMDFQGACDLVNAGLSTSIFIVNYIEYVRMKSLAVSIY